MEVVINSRLIDILQIPALPYKIKTLKRLGTVMGANFRKSELRVEPFDSVELDTGSTLSMISASNYAATYQHMGYRVNVYYNFSVDTMYNLLIDKAIEVVEW